MTFAGRTTGEGAALGSTTSVTPEGAFAQACASGSAGARSGAASVRKVAQASSERTGIEARQIVFNGLTVLRA
ncbi:MAG TPA: hypothetical protein VM821_00220 [Abditibacteriaceae bacterium]|nr:hypothetical protein [Abditibacteriaceae bacterium]